MIVSNNLVVGQEPTDFFVWIDPANWLVSYHIRTLGCFISGGWPARRSNLPFLPNPEFDGPVTPFQMTVMKEYTAEYNLEINREHSFSNYPSRLNAIFLLQSEADAQDHEKRHPAHVGNRVLRRVRSAGQYTYSTHDSGWIDFMRLRHGMPDESIRDSTHAYWQGRNVEDHTLESMGAAWTQPPIREVLCIGRIDFYDRTLPA